MKLLLATALLLSVFLSSCKKEGASDMLTGTWKLTAVYDKSTSTTAIKPATAHRDIIIHFTKGSKFSGHTIANSLMNGEYTLNGNQILFGSYESTDVNEDSWGSSFRTVLSSCMLQSISPCQASTVTVSGSVMVIDSPMRYTLTLQRI